MVNLAILGHATRGNEVIEILEMLGGRNVRNYACDLTDYAYNINGQGIINWYIPHPNSPLVIYTLEEFLEKFPYKVGDKVIVKGLSEYPKNIHFMKWYDGNIHYSFDSETWFLPAALKPYKEETMEKEKKYYDEWLLTDYLEFEDNDGTWADEVEVNLGKDYEIQIRGDKTFIVKKKSQYPKTYEECCKILLLKPERATYSVSGLEYERHLIVNLQRLLICRDAYWKIAGEQMGLGKLWKPDWEKADEKKYCIVNTEGNVAKWVQKTTNKILAFPTEEMRDAFYENFKDLIELVKELL